MENTPPQIRLVPITSDAQVILTPGSELLLDDREKQLLLRAYDTEMSVCTTKRGHEFAIGSGDARAPWIRELIESRYSNQPLGPVDLTRVSQYGYWDPAVIFAGPSVTFDGPSTPTDVLRACDHDVTDRLAPNTPQGVTSLIHGADRVAANDDRLEAADQEWGRCMSAKGHSYSAPGRASFEFKTKPKLTKRELAVARADIVCQRSSRRIDTFVALMIAYQNQAIERHPTLFANFRSWKTDTLARATEIVASTPLPSNRTEEPALTRHRERTVFAEGKP